MTTLLLAHFVAAALAPGIVRLLGRRTFLVLALVPLAAFVWLVAHSAQIIGGGQIVETTSWVPTLALDLDLRIGTLQWLLGLIVTGVGALVLLYCGWYFKRDDPSLWRFSGVFVAFSGAMLGLVLSDNLLALYVYWELTSVFSYTLIGHNPVRSANRRAAMQALLVTTMGGLAMLVGLIILGETSSYSIGALLADPPPAGTLTTVAIVLVLLGALTKSAQVPFHFWLPGAMAAPTPVSAYLHAASMVKAGIFLVALLAPAFADTPGWRPLTLGLGGLTMLVGGWRALRQHDIKLILAYGTVSQLGFLIALAGLGTPQGALAAVALVASHALFKATLFLVVGVVDKGTGTRDLHQLSGLARSAPVLTATAVVAGLSMAGIPPLLGFVAKESALEAALQGTHHGPLGAWGWPFVVVLVVGSALTVAYTARFLWGGFAPKRTLTGEAFTTPFAAPTPLLISPILLAAASLVLGFAGPQLTKAFAPYVETLSGHEIEKLALWHGLTPALGLSALAIAAGLLLFAARDLVADAQGRVPRLVDSAAGYNRTMRGLDRLSIEVTALSQRGSLPTYLSTIFLVVIALPGLTAITALPGTRVRAWDSVGQAAAGLIVVASAILATRTRDRLQTAILVGVCGYGLAVLFLLHGAPDLALTQVLVETVSLVVFVLVLRNLPAIVPRRALRFSRAWQAGLSAAFGAAVTVMVAVAANARVAPPVSTRFPEQAYDFGHGRNVVNVTLVDIRAWDTLGEISVVVAAATGVASLIFVRMRDVELSHPPRRSGSTALERRAPAPPERRSVILETTTRLLFHVMIAVSAYLMFAGHNQAGGGFAGGLTAGLALLVRYLAGGRTELDKAAPIEAGVLLGLGLAVSVAAAIAPLFFGGTILQSAVIDLDLPLYGHVKLVTALVFDIGVYLVVIGLALGVVRSLGGGIDAQNDKAAELQREGVSAP